MLKVSKRIAAFVLSTGLVGALSEPARSDGYTLEKVESVFSTFGYRHKVDIDATHCRVSIYVNQERVHKSGRALQAGGMVNPDLTDGQLDHLPTVLASIFANKTSSLVTETVYKTHKEADKCFFEAVLEAPDSYGNDQEEKIFSYQFDRALYERINWRKFEPSDLYKVAPKWEFGLPVMRRVIAEADRAMK